MYDYIEYFLRLKLNSVTENVNAKFKEQEHVELFMAPPNLGIKYQVQ